MLPDCISTAGISGGSATASMALPRSPSLKAPSPRAVAGLLLKSDEAEKPVHSSCPTRLGLGLGSAVAVGVAVGVR